MASRKPTRENKERAKEIARLKLQGMTFEEIGEKFNISRQRAHQIYEKRLEQEIFDLVLLGATPADVARVLKIEESNPKIKPIYDEWQEAKAKIEGRV